jgi:molybdopterin molybdotransferase
VRSVDDHLAGCLAAISPLPAREVLLLDGLGCLLAEDVVSAIDLPRFDNSSMDGYAVRAGELAGADDDRPVLLPVLGDIPAGHGEPVRLEPGNTVRIMTGAPMPAGADAVVPVEWTDGGTGQVLIRRTPSLGAYVRRSAEDVAAGQTVLRAGVRLTSRQIALLAAVGRDRVLVQPRPLVLVMPSGSELVPPGKPLGPGQIHDSNGYALIAAVREAGADAEHGGVIDDDPAAVSTAIEQAARRADLVITTGGVSAGAYDTIKEVLRELGTVEFARVAMQPGSPQGFGVVGPNRTPIFTLPGNPVSALVSFEVFVSPALRLLAGETSPAPVVEETAVAAVDWTSPLGRRQFVRAVLESPPSADNGEPRVRPVGGQGSHLVADLAEATCLVIVPEDVDRVSAGDRLRYRRLDAGAGAVGTGAGGPHGRSR